MGTYSLDPLEDPRWSEFIEAAPSASIFHSPGWLHALRDTYSYEPVVYTTAPAGARLADAILLCRVRSWLTGSRMVSLPFSDHCEPLVQGSAPYEELVGAVRRDFMRHWRYIELRPKTCLVAPSGFYESARFVAHTIDLRPSEGIIHGRFHQDSIQRKLRRAGREMLVYEEGRSPELLDAFYVLQSITRRRHGWPPQPRAWFAAILERLGTRATICAARSGGRVVGALLTLRHRDTLVYKYGCSDARSHAAGVMPFLFWECIRRAKAAGCAEFDLGRSDERDVGLVTFKDRLGAVRSPLVYFRSGDVRERARSARLEKTARWLAARLPEPAFRAAGRFLYRHVG